LEKQLLVGGHLHVGCQSDIHVSHVYNYIALANFLATGVVQVLETLSN